MTINHGIRIRINNSQYPVSPIIAILVTIIQIVFLIWLFLSWHYDDPFITYRYASNLINGMGFVYNPGERVLSTTTPLFTFLLAGLGYIWSDIPKIATIIGCISSGISGLIFWDLARQWKMDIASWVGLLLIPTFPLIVITISSETPLYIALVLATLDCYVRCHYRWAAIFASLLILVRPDGVLLPLIIVIYFLFGKKRPIPWIALGIFIIITGLWFGFSWLYFGSPLPITLMTKQHQGVMSISQLFAPGLLRIAGSYTHQWNYVIEALIALIGAGFILVRRHPIFILVFWTLTYFLAYTILGVTRYFWYYAPLVPGFIALVGAGFQWIYELLTRIHWHRFINIHLERFLYISLVILWIYQGIDLSNISKTPDSRYFIYRSIGEWLNNNTDKYDRIGALEIGIIGYYAKNPIVDFAGLIQPNVAKQMHADSTYEDTARWAIMTYKPSYIVLNPLGFPTLMKDLVNKQCQIAQYFRKEDYNTNQNMVIYRCQGNT
jgi:hypothetical protein